MTGMSPGLQALMDELTGTQQQPAGDGWDWNALYTAYQMDQRGQQGQQSQSPNAPMQAILSQTDQAERDAMLRAQNLNAVAGGLQRMSTAFRPDDTSVQLLQRPFGGQVQMNPNLGSIGLQRLIESISGGLRRRF